MSSGGNPFKAKVPQPSKLPESEQALLSSDLYATINIVTPICAALSVLVSLSVLLSYLKKKWRNRDPSRLSFFLSLSDFFASILYGLSRYIAALQFPWIY